MSVNRFMQFRIAINLVGDVASESIANKRQYYQYNIYTQDYSKNEGDPTTRNVTDAHLTNLGPERIHYDVWLAGVARVQYAREQNLMEFRTNGILSQK